MQPQDGALLFQVRADQSLIQKDVEAIKKQFEQMTRKAVEEGKKQADVWQTLLKGATAYFTLQGAQSFISQMVAVRSEFQQLEISFGTMLKSKEKANALMAQLTDLAAKTPFGLQEVSEGAKRLLAFQVPAQEVTETLRRMGDVAAGLGVPMGQLIHVYGQVKAQGKLMTNDLYQFMNAGIPIIAELSKVVGKSETEIKDMVSAGKIGFTEIQAVIKNMTSEGGLFFNLMAEQSKSLGGQISNLQDNFDQMLNEIGKASEGVVSGAISGVAYLVENYQTLGKLIAGLVATYGTYKAAIIVHNTLVALSTQLTNGWTVAQLAQYRGLLLLEKAQKLLNATMLANPYIFMATAVAALGAAMFILTDRTSAAEKAQKRLNEEREVAMAKEQEHKQHIEELIDSATNQYLADTDRRKALTELAGAYPQIFAKYDIESIKLADILKLKKEIAEFDANKARGQRQTDYSKNKEYAKILYDIGTKQGSKGFDEIAKGSDLDRIITEKFGNHWRTFGNYSEIYAYFNEKQKNAKKELKSDALSDWTANLKNQSEDELKKQLEQRKHLIADLQKQEKEGKKWASHGIKFGEEWYAFNKEELQTQAQAIQSQLDRLHEKTYSYTDLSKKYAAAVKDAEKALADITNNKAGYKTETDYQKAVSEAKENLKQAKKVYDDFTVKPSKTKKEKTKTEFDTEKAQQDHQRQIQDDLFRQEEARIKIMQEGAEKRLAVIQLEYDKQEEEIRRRSQDQLAAFIENEKQKAEASGKWKKGQDFDTNTEAINAEKARLAENEKTLLASNAEYQRIQQEQVYKELLEKYQTYTDQRKVIEEKYNADIATLQAKLGADAPQVKKAQDEKARELKKLDILYKKEGTAIAKLFDNLRKKTVKEIRQTITDAEAEIDALASTLDMGDKDNVEYIQSLRQQIEQVRDTAERSDTTFGRLGTNIKNLFKAKPNTAEWQEAFNGMLSSAQSITGEFTQLGQEFERLGQSTGNESLKNFANSINELGNIVNKTLSFAQIGGSVGGGWGAAIGGVIGAVYGIYEKIESNKERARQRERQWKEQEIQYEKKINDLRDQRILKGEKHTNPFTTDKIGKHLDILNNYKEKLKGLRSDVAKIENTQIFDHYEKRTEWFPEWGVIYREYQEAITKPFKEKFGSLFLKNGEIDFEALERLNPNSKEFRTFLKSTKDIRNPEIQAGTDNAINQAKEVYAKIKEYRGEIEKYVQETFGEFGSSFTDSIISAVEKGGNAFENFGQTVARVMKNLIKQMLVTNDVKKIFDKFQKDMEEVYASSVGLSNEQIYEKVKNKTVDFVNNILKPEIQKGEQKAKAMFDALEQSGIKMYDEQGRRAAEKGYMRMSQDTGNDLLGQFRLQTQLSAEIKNAALQTANFIREMHQSMQNNAAQQLRHLAGIEANTYKLNKIETDIASVKTILGNIDTKGIKMRT
ncbi:tape measure protein [Capnocytophaga leadbetteri]|uniref:tape measure protein n=1 Tax=Capnocytophaga leadbetteri TaxID=327575 RepID=UPI0028F03008|nr:tape measure protein [Capnocytophaga leadbetteri]